MKWWKLYTKNRARMSLIKMLQRIRIQLLLIRLRIKNVSTMNVFEIIRLAKLRCMNLYLWEILCLDVTHKEESVRISSWCSRKGGFKFWKLFSVAQGTVYLCFEKVAAFSTNYEACFVLSWIRDAQPTPTNEFILAFAKQSKSFCRIL